MKLLIVVIVAIIGCVSAIPQVPSSLAKETDFVCKDGKFQPNDRVVAGMVKCKTETMNPKCEYYCVAKVLGLLEDNGVPSRASYARWTKNTFPENLHEKTLKHFNDCLDKYATKLTPDDQSCDDALMFNDCTWSAAPSLTC